MSGALRRRAGDLAARGMPAVVVEVVATRGSAPRDAGTRMLVGPDAIDGTIGGGHLEWRAIATARRMLGDASFRPADESFSLGAALGQCCGGAVTLRWRMLDAAALAAWPIEPRAPTIQVFGAGHVGRALVHVLSTLDVDLRWIDERESAFPPAPSAGRVARLCVEPVEAEVDAAPPGCFHLVLTHRHDLDLRIVEAILRRGDFAWLGLIGSTTKRRRFAQLLAQRGIDAAAIDRIACPIGIDGIAGKEPAHIAIAVAAQLVPLLDAARAAGQACAADGSVSGFDAA